MNGLRLKKEIVIEKMLGCRQILPLPNRDRG
jgi:hypothetical protein